MSNTFENENITVKVDRKPNCEVHLDIEIQPIACDAAKERAVKNVRKEISLPGFRKGKAPMDTVLSKYGTQIEREFKDILLNTAIREAIQLSSLYPLKTDGNIKADIKSQETGKAALVTASFEIAPDVPEIDPKQLTLNLQNPEDIDSSKVDDHIENLRFQHAEWNDLEKDAIEKEDYVDLDLAMIDAEGKETPLGEDRRFFLKEGEVEPWLFDLLIGKKVGEVIEGERPADENEEAKKIKITVKAIKSVDLPEVNDEFATKFKMESADQLREKVKEHLEKQAVETVKEKHREQVQQELLKAHSFEIPGSLLESETKSRMQSFLQTIDEKRRDEVKEEVEKNARKASEDSLRLYYLIGRFLSEKKLEVTEQEVMQELMTQVLYQNPSLLQNEEAMAQAKSQVQNELMIRKALDKVFELAGQ